MSESCDFVSVPGPARAYIAEPGLLFSHSVLGGFWESREKVSRLQGAVPVNRDPLLALARRWCSRTGLLQKVQMSTNIQTPLSKNGETD